MTSDSGDPLRDRALFAAHVHKFLVSIILDTTQGNLITAVPISPVCQDPQAKKDEDSHSSESLCQMNSERTRWNTPKEAISPLLEGNGFHRHISNTVLSRMFRAQLDPDTSWVSGEAHEDR